MFRRLLLVAALLFAVGSAGITVYGVTVREAGRRELARVLAEQEPEELGDGNPAVDADRQARIRAWLRTVDADAALRRTRPETWIWRLERDTPPAEVATLHEAFRPDAGRLAALMGEGPVSFARMGWPRPDPSRPVPAPPPEYLPDLQRIRAAGRWFASEAVAAGDPLPALAALDRLEEGLSRPGCLLDTMFALTFRETRDDAYLVLDAVGRLPENRRVAWMEEPPRGRDLVADGLRAERLLYGTPLSSGLGAGRTVHEIIDGNAELDGTSADWVDRCRTWVYAPGDCAVYLRAMAQAERCIRECGDEGVLIRAREACSGLGLPFALMLPNPEALSTVAKGSDTGALLVRAAACIVGERRRRGGLPTSVEEARAWIRAVQPPLLDRLPVETFHYVRFDDHRIRLFVDGLDAPPGPEPRSGTPLVRYNGFLELRVP